MVSVFIPLLAASVIASPQKIGRTPSEPVSAVKTMAVLPWSYKDGTDGAVKTANDTLDTLFEKYNFETTSKVKVKSAWEDQMHMSEIKEVISNRDSFPDLPKAEDLLKLGKLLGVKYVCAGRAFWHTKSVWVNLGPKTKADCTVDCIVIDVAKEEIALNAKDVKADSTRKEAGLETAGALLVSMGITSLSGGPKTPHQQRSAVLAISDALKPFLTDSKSKKIGGG